MSQGIPLTFLDCEDCEEVYDGDCPIHGPLKCLDPNAGWDEDSKTYTTVPVPAQLTVKRSDIIGAGKDTCLPLVSCSYYIYPSILYGQWQIKLYRCYFTAL